MLHTVMRLSSNFTIGQNNDFADVISYNDDIIGTSHVNHYIQDCRNSVRISLSREPAQRFMEDIVSDGRERVHRWKQDIHERD